MDSNSLKSHRPSQPKHSRNLAEPDGICAWRCIDQSNIGRGFAQNYSRPIYYIETYLASGRFHCIPSVVANAKPCGWCLDNGISFEFVLSDDEILMAANRAPMPKPFWLMPGWSWRYRIFSARWRLALFTDDTIKFINKEESEIIITGRTQTFLESCGEHLSVDNMNKAVKSGVERVCNISIPEFTVAGVPMIVCFAHHWYIGTGMASWSHQTARQHRQSSERRMTDYAVERSAAFARVLDRIAHGSVSFMQPFGEQGQSGTKQILPCIENVQLDDWKIYKQLNQVAPVPTNVLEGVQFGILAFLIGPVFLTILQNQHWERDFSWSHGGHMAFRWAIFCSHLLFWLI